MNSSLKSYEEGTERKFVPISSSSGTDEDEAMLGTDLFTTGMTSIDPLTPLSNNRTLDIDQKFK